MAARKRVVYKHDPSTVYYIDIFPARLGFVPGAVPCETKSLAGLAANTLLSRYCATHCQSGTYVAKGYTFVQSEGGGVFWAVGVERRANRGGG